MVEYIKREDAIKAFDNVDANVIQDYDDDNGIGFSYRCVRNTLKDVPAADVAPVIHGTWVEGSFAWDETCGICGYHEFTCSECGFDTTDKYGLSRYCPDCGARMKRGKQPRNE